MRGLGGGLSAPRRGAGREGWPGRGQASQATLGALSWVWVLVVVWVWVWVWVVVVVVVPRSPTDALLRHGPPGTWTGLLPRSPTLDCLPACLPA